MTIFDTFDPNNPPPYTPPDPPLTEEELAEATAEVERVLEELGLTGEDGTVAS